MPAAPDECADAPGAKITAIEMAMAAARPEAQ